MKATAGCLIGLVFTVTVGAEPLVEGRVLLPSGAPVPGAEVRLFDVSDLRTAPLATKKTILILWWWNPKSDDPADTIVDDTLFGDSFDEGKDSVDGIGGWNFSGVDDDDVTNKLSTYYDQMLKARKLWLKIKSKNGEFNPPPD